MLDCVARGRWKNQNVSKTHCAKHDENYARCGKQRVCRSCRRETVRRHRAKHKVEVSLEEGIARALASGRTAA